MSTDKSGYNWTRFYGDPVSFNELTDVPYSTLMVDEEGYLCLEEDKVVGSPMDFVSQISANALKGKASGSAVAIDDVSPLEHEMSVKVSSKNLAKHISASDNVVFENGVATQIEADTYGTIYLKAQTWKDNTVTSELVSVIQNIGRHSTSITIPAKANKLVFGLNGKTIDTIVSIDVTDLPEGIYTVSADFTNITQGSISWRDIQLEKGTTATAYTPYIADVSTVSVKRYGKNLIDFESFWGDKFNRQEDGSYLSNTEIPSGRRDYYLPPAIYTVNYSFKSPVGCNYRIRLFYEDGDVVEQYVASTGEYQSYQFKTDGKRAVAQIAFNYSKPSAFVQIKELQIEVGEQTPYEPYIEPTTYAVEADGTVEGVRSLSPSTTLMADNSGALIECKYNRDLNKAFEELTQAIISMGGNV